jgi:hypothetical protein
VQIQAGNDPSGERRRLNQLDLAFDGGGVGADAGDHRFRLRDPRLAGIDQDDGGRLVFRRQHYERAGGHDERGHGDGPDQARPPSQDHPKAAQIADLADAHVVCMAAPDDRIRIRRVVEG